jgi:hypothetical protein
MYVADIDFASVSAIFYFILELFWLWNIFRIH